MKKKTMINGMKHPFKDEMLTINEAAKKFKMKHYRIKKLLEEGKTLEQILAVKKKETFKWNNTGNDEWGKLGKTPRTQLLRNIK